jgi:hypothetical protein
VAAGFATGISFGSGDLDTLTAKGFNDAIVIKYNTNGEVVWVKTFGGTDAANAASAYASVTAVSDGFVATGVSDYYSFGNGDWAGVPTNGDADAIAVRYDNNGAVVWQKNFGGEGHDYFNAVAANTSGIFAAGYSYYTSFNTGDLTGIMNKGSDDAIIAKYGTFVPVSNITDVIDTAVVSIDLPLAEISGTVLPANASNKDIVWSLKSAGTTGAVVMSNTTITETGAVIIGDPYLHTTAPGTLVLTATIASGLAVGTDYTQDFSITITPSPPLPPSAYAFTSTAGVGGKLFGTSSDDYAPGTDIIVMAIADDDYCFVRWTASGVTLTDDTVNYVMFSMPANAVTLTAEFMVIQGTGVKESTMNNEQLIIYPNPTTGEIRLTNLDFRLTIDDIKIYDVVGRLQQSKIVNLQSEIVLDISHLANGLYFLKVGDKTVKVIKE